MPVGQPRAFKTVKELEDGIDDYLAQDKPLCIAGLAAHLEVNKDTITEYGKGTYDEGDDRYSVPIKKVVQFIEAQTVEKLLNGKHNPVGSIFVLKNNFKWKDQQHVKEESTRKTKVAIDEESMPNVAAAVAKLISESR